MRAAGARLLVAGTLLAGAIPARAQDAPPGKAVYDRWCAGCHGEDGKGAGPAATTMLPRPRDFTGALYQIRTTPSGALPTDADILRVIDEGMPGTAMPGWKDHLSQESREALVEILKGFSAFFESGEAPESIEIGNPPGGGEEAVAEGREIYEKIECWKCHGQAGRGDGPSAPTLVDEDDLPIRASDLTEGWSFNGGSSVEAIYTRLRTGLDGTPMPSFSDLIESEVVTEEELWRVAQYVASLSPEPPEVREVVRAVLVESLPSGLDDPRWAEVGRSYVPLVGQVIAEPRWFAPSVDGVWVQALHDGKELALVLTWHDPSRSPDPDWEEWKAKIRATMSEAAAPLDTTAAVPPLDQTNADTSAPAAALPAPDSGFALGDPYDALVVQFPTSIPEGMERPYFLMGSRDDPVYLWVWDSRREGAREAVGRGLASLQPLQGESSLAAQAAYTDGEWRLFVHRPLAAAEAEGRLQFEAGRPIPVALFAWDGSNGESGTRGSISTWYFLYLDQPAGSGQVVWPILATLLTAGLGFVFVTRAQRRGRDASRSERD